MKTKTIWLFVVLPFIAFCPCLKAQDIKGSFQEQTQSEWQSTTTYSAVLQPSQTEPAHTETIWYNNKFGNRAKAQLSMWAQVGSSWLNLDGSLEDTKYCGGFGYDYMIGPNDYISVEFSVRGKGCKDWTPAYVQLDLGDSYGLISNKSSFFGLGGSFFLATPVSKDGADGLSSIDVGSSVFLSYQFRHAWLKFGYETSWTNAVKDYKGKYNSLFLRLGFALFP